MAGFDAAVCLWPSIPYQIIAGFTISCPLIFIKTLLDMMIVSFDKRKIEQGGRVSLSAFQRQASEFLRGENHYKKH